MLYVVSVKRCNTIDFYIGQCTKTRIIKFKPTTTAHAPLDIYYNDKLINEAKSSKFLGMHKQPAELEIPCRATSS